MKTITLFQPWASLVILGAKRFETRAWNTNHRGPLAIHASKRFSREHRALCAGSPFFEALRALGADSIEEDLPRGAIIGTVDLFATYRTEVVRGTHIISRDEEDFGDYADGRFAWELRNPRPCPPIPARGQLGIWTWEPSHHSEAR